MARYVIADLHFGHMWAARNRGFRTIEEHNQAIIDNWNSTVTKRDKIYVLGDVAWYKKDADECLPLLQGIKSLIAGNHDDPKVVNRHFDEVGGAIVLNKLNVLLTHIPIHPTELYWDFNIHGHLHSNVIKRSDNLEPDLNYICVSCEHTAMRPIDLDELVEYSRMRRK